MSAPWPLPVDLPGELTRRGWRVQERLYRVAPGAHLPERVGRVLRIPEQDFYAYASVWRAAGNVWEALVRYEWGDSGVGFRHSRTPLSERSTDPLALVALADAELDRLDAALRLGWVPGAENELGDGQGVE